MDHRGSQGSPCEHHLTGGRSVVLGLWGSILQHVLEGHIYVMICGSGGFRNPLAKAQTGLEESQLVEQLESLGETSGAAGSWGPRGLASSLASCSQASRHLREPQTPSILSPHLLLGRSVEDKRPLTYFPLL